MTGPGGAPKSSSEQPELPTQNELAMERTVMAYERTLMAWLRTAIAMISFGFSLHQVFKLLVSPDRRPASSPFSPSTYGLAMIVTGLSMLVMAMIQNEGERRKLRERGWHLPFPLALTFSAATLILGLLALVGTLVTLH